MVFDRHANMRYKFGNRKFWAEGHCVSTVGLNEATIAKCIREQEAADIALEQAQREGARRPVRQVGPAAAALCGPPRVNGNAA